MEHIGIDVHKQASQICILTDEGELIEKRIATRRERFKEMLGEREPTKVLIEASTESEWVARCIESLGHEVVVADPNYAPMYGHGHHRRQKTDRRDAQALAEACRIGAYRKTHRSSDRSRDLRARLAVRDALVSTRVRHISLIRALLRQEGLRVASGTAEHFPKRVGAIALPAHVHQQVHPLLTVMEQVTEELREIDHALSSIAEDDEVAARLCSVPSVGPVTAIAFATTVDDPHRFQTAHQLQSYLGLVPRERSSGEQVRKGRITKTGNPRVRRLLVQAAVSIMRLRFRTTQRLWRWAEQLSKRRGKMVAIVALARRLAGVLWAMMRDRSVYQPTLGLTPILEGAA